MKMRYPILLVAGFLAAVPAALAAPPQRIGSWVIACPDRGGPCAMRYGKRFVEAGGVTGDLEVLSQHGALVPAITLRGLPQDVVTAASATGNAEGWMTLGDGARQNLGCYGIDSGFICVPEGAAARALAAGLPAAPAIKIRVGLSAVALPPQERALDLAGTAAAIARLKAAGGAMPVPKPTVASAAAGAIGTIAADSALQALRNGEQPPAGMTAMADRMLKAAGYQGGVAALQARLQNYLHR